MRSSSGTLIHNVDDFGCALIASQNLSTLLRNSPDQDRQSREIRDYKPVSCKQTT